MRVKSGDRLCLDAPAEPEPTDDLLFHDYYSRTPQIRLAGGGETRPERATEIMLDGSEIGKIVACALRHPSLNMQQAVLTAIWNHPESFRAIFRFGLEAPEAFAEIRKIVAEELARRGPTPDAGAGEGRAADKALLPRMPTPAHLRDRKRH
jgi:hypothetical protein